MKSVFYGAMFALLFVFSRTFGGEIEGQYFPVVTEVEITRAVQIDPASTRIWGSFFRARDCQFADISFFLGDKEKSSSALLQIEERSKVRDVGYTDFGPWVVHLTLEQLQENSYSVATHRCHPFWEVKTLFH